MPYKRQFQLIWSNFGTKNRGFRTINPKQKLVNYTSRAPFRLQILPIGQKNQCYYIRAKRTTIAQVNSFLQFLDLILDQILRFWGSKKPKLLNLRPIPANETIKPSKNNKSKSI